MFGQVDILELLPEHQILSTNIKNIKELYQIDYGDTVETNPVLSKEYMFDKKGKLIREIEYEKFINKGDTIRVIIYYYKDSLLTKQRICTYPRFDNDSIVESEIIYTHTYDGNRLESFNRDNSYKEYYFYNEQGLIDSLISNWFFENKTSIYVYRDNGSLKKIRTYNSNNDEIESITLFDQSNREIKYNRFTPGNSHTTLNRKTKYNRNNKIRMSAIGTVEKWKIKKYYSYNQQDLLNSVKVKTIYPRSVSYEILIGNDSEDSSEKIKMNQKSNKEIEKRTVVKSHYIYKYNSNNFPVQIAVDLDQRVLRPLARTFIYEYY